MIITTYFDGGCKGNPGDMVAKFVIVGVADEPIKRSIPVGYGTSNQSEYLSLLVLLKTLETINPSDVRIYGDSKLVVEQVRGKWNIREDSHRVLARKCQKILKQHPGWLIDWIPREMNIAD